MKTEPTDEEKEEAERDLKIGQYADSEFGREGELEFDDVPIISEDPATNGAYVQAWVWVDFAGTEFDKEKENES